jgi:hypothetical protein
MFEGIIQRFFSDAINLASTTRLHQSPQHQASIDAGTPLNRIRRRPIPQQAFFFQGFGGRS